MTNNTELIVTVNSGKLDEVATAIENLSIRKGMGVVIKSKMQELDTIVLEMDLKYLVQLMFVKDVIHITKSVPVSTSADVEALVNALAGG